MRVLRAVVQGLGELFITLGLVLLLFVAWQLWWTDVESGRTQQATTRSLERTWTKQLQTSPPTTSPPTTSPPTTRPPTQPAAKVPLGRAFALIRVPRFGKDYVRPILQGTKLSVLDEGVGHYGSSAWPGEVGNFALAGHRVTYAKPFNQIADLRRDDPIVIETSTTWYVYRVVRHVIVTPDRVDVVAPVPEKPGAVPTMRMMTMTACHPKFSARQRYVVFSRLAQTIPKAGGAVPDVLTVAAKP